MWLLIILSTCIATNEQTVDLIQYDSFEQCNEVREIMLDQMEMESDESTKNYEIDFKCVREHDPLIRIYKL